MGKSSHFIGQPMYGQVIKLLDKSKILRISRKKGGERYTKRFNGWIHLVVMLWETSQDRQEEGRDKGSYGHPCQ